MSNPGVVVFDVNETLSDMSPLGQRFVDVGAPAELVKLWFASLLRDAFGLAAAGTSARFADLAAGGLRVVLAGRTGDVEAAVTHVMDGFSALPLHPDVVEGVDALRAMGLRLITLSNGSASVAERLLGEAGIRDRFEALLSVEQAGAWKPAPASYRYAAETCAVAPEEMVLVAVHPWDTDGAMRAGLQAAWINRDGGVYPDYLLPPTWTASSLPALASLLKSGVS